MHIRTRTGVIAAGLFTAAALIAGGGALAGPASAAPLVTATCNACIHVQNVYAFRGALDAVHQATAVNSPVSLWYETPTATDAGADLLGLSVGTVVASATNVNFGQVNQSALNWVDYIGDSVVRFKYDPFGNGGANTYIGLNGTKIALRHDNPDSVWQEFIEVPTDGTGHVDGTSSSGLGGVADACGDLGSPVGVRHCVLIDVGQTANTEDPFVVTDPNDAVTGSLVQQDVEQATLNQNAAVATNQVWDFRN